MAFDQGRLSARPATPGRTSLATGVHPLATPPAATGRSTAPLLAVPAQLGAGAPLLVFLHGAGGTGAASLGVVRSAADERGCLVLLPTSVAPTWDFLAGSWGPDVARLDAALAEVFDHFPVGRVALGGFSDGASYALSLGLANGDLVEALLAFSPGFAAPPAQVGRPRVWISHGTQDAVLPIERCGRPTARRLARAGYEVEYDEFVGPHVVASDAPDRALAWWLDEPA
jgi:predicted esterase